MENVIIKELCTDWKNIESFLVFLKKKRKLALFSSR